MPILGQQPFFEKVITRADKKVIYRSRREFGSNPVWFLIGLNFLFFIATIIVPALIAYLGLMPAGAAARPWTILTSMFLHNSMGHILANMFTLYFFGSYICALIGGKRFLIVYFVGGIAGGILYILLAPRLSIAVGASGAVFALGGMLTVMRPKLRVYVFPLPVALPIWVSVIGGFFIISFFPRVAWQAHLGGLVFGLAAGYFFRRRGTAYG